MNGEHGIPMLSLSSKNLTHFSTMLISHLNGIGESRLLDANNALQRKEVITKTLNPKWVPLVEATTAYSDDTRSSVPPHPASKAPAVPVPQLYNVSHWESVELVESYSPDLNTLGSAKTVPCNLLNQSVALCKTSGQVPSPPARLPSRY
jgi:hypothetical protein